MKVGNVAFKITGLKNASFVFLISLRLEWTAQWSEGGDKTYFHFFTFFTFSEPFIYIEKGKSPILMFWEFFALKYWPQNPCPLAIIFGFHEFM